MLRKTMLVLATAAALTGGLTVESFARGGGGPGGHGGGFGGGGAQIGGGLGGAHIGGGLGGAHIGGGYMSGGYGGEHFGGQAFGRGTEGQHFAGARGYVGHDMHFDHHRHFGRGFIFGPSSDYDFNDYSCGYPYYSSAVVVCPPADLN